MAISLFMPFMGFSALKEGIPTWILGDIPTYSEGLNTEDETYSQLFAVKSYDKDLSFEVYSSSGKKIPGNIYRYHNDGEITYEIGRGLKEGLYIVKISDKEIDQYVKLIRYGY